MIQLPGRHWSSWGCVQALTVTLAILFLPVLASALEPGIDLLEALNLYTNHTRYIGITMIPDKKDKKLNYFNFSADEKIQRNLVLPSAAYRKVVESMRRSTEFTFSANLRQKQNNIGTIISFTHGINRYLELQSSGRYNEIRFYYSTRSSNGNTSLQEEIFTYHLADYEWHKLALSVSGTEVLLFINCHPVYRRVIRFMPDRNFSASNMQLLLGQSSTNSFQFKGDIKEAHIIPGPYGYTKQCPTAEQSCPTCGQFSLLQETVAELTHNLINLTKRLVAAERRVSVLEQCDCKKSCKMIDGVIRNDGDVWNVKCETCKCVQGNVTCEPYNCGPPKCKFPQKKEGECCPICLKNCFVSNKLYDHGEFERINCGDCTCIDGTMKCERFECKKLSCPVAEQIKVSGECCPICPGDDYCSKGHACHTNATCHNLNTKYMCTCHPGFQGNGLMCADIDECAEKGGQTGNHCHLNTKCVNTDGSYTCECLPGYRRLDKFNCVEIDECATNQHTCHKNADCINTLGSYNCQCNSGYQGDGEYCEPVCNQTCKNGGQCLAPGVCTCPKGYTGASCEEDIDECKLGTHSCKNSTICMNIPGWFHCECKPGYFTTADDCEDINECEMGTHSCHSSANCVNTNGHFECQCSIDDPSCKLSCMFKDLEFKDGSVFSPSNQPCQECTCQQGVITCKDRPCNCSTWNRDDSGEICCPQCDPKKSCQHQELKHVVFKSGEQWIFQCQTCECLYGEVDCWHINCPAVTCDNPKPSGDCCPRCEDDPCRNITDSSGLPCRYKGYMYESGQTFSDVSSPCTTCACKNGRLCCSFNINCNDDESRSSESSSSTSYTNISNSYTTSKTTKASKATFSSSYPSFSSEAAAAAAAASLSTSSSPKTPPSTNVRRRSFKRSTTAFNSKNWHTGHRNNNRRSSDERVGHSARTTNRGS